MYQTNSKNEWGQYYTNMYFVKNAINKYRIDITQISNLISIQLILFLCVVSSFPVLYLVEVQPIILLILYLCCCRKRKGIYSNQR